MDFSGRQPGEPLAPFHDINQTFAVWLVSCRHTLYKAQRPLGHTDSQTTMRCAPSALAALLKAVIDVMGFQIHLQGEKYG